MAAYVVVDLTSADPVRAAQPAGFETRARQLECLGLRRAVGGGAGALEFVGDQRLATHDPSFVTRLNAVCITGTRFDVTAVIMSDMDPP